MELREMIPALCALSGPSGFEGSVADRVEELLRPYTDEIRRDVLGSVIAVRRCGREGARKLLLDAHMDEIGFIVTGAEDGFIRFQTLGGVDPRMLPASGIRFLTEPPIYGVVSVMPVHALKEDEREKPMKIEDLAIDCGLTQAEAERLLPPGTPAVYDAEPAILGEHSVCAKTQDDRACLSAIIRAMELLKDEALDIDVYVLASTQEEVGLRGAEIAAFSVFPDWGIAVDVSHAATPDCSDWRTQKLGEGPVISRGPNMNRALTDLAIRAAEENGIKYQICVEPGGDSGTNTAVIQTAREGVATALFSLPLKYMHTPVEITDLRDGEALARLIAETVRLMSGGERDA